LSNYPSPTNNYTMINYTFPFVGQITMEIHNLMGETVNILLNEMQAEGEYSLKFDSEILKPGVFIANIKFKNEDFELMKCIKPLCSR